ncbi:MAG: PEGA domain-containing protein [bacterium]|nr:PEGA domain-containing protein [bacterium]
MDFLDPRKRRLYDIRLMIGYGLMAIAIGLTSIILVYGAYGYGINTKTGAVIQNGLVFVDSKPSGASIYLNNVVQGNTTSARLVLPAGNYDLAIKKSGYRDWIRKFTLNEHSIARYDYPLLFPTKLASNNLKVYPSQPLVITASPDKHWLLVQAPSTDPKNIIFDMYDTGKLDQAPTQLALPPALLNGNTTASSLSTVEWATDNNHLLLKHSYQGGDEFIIFNRSDPAASVNVSQFFGVVASKMSLRNKKIDQLYILKQADNSLSLGDVNKGTLQPLLSNILAYNSYGSDLLSYVTAQNVTAGQVIARIWENGKNYPLYTFAAGNKYFLDADQYKGHWYYVAGSDSADRINIYKDPLSGLKDPNTAKAIPLIALPDSGIGSLAFSDKARFIGVQAGQKFGVYDIETQSRYQYTLAAPISSEMHWMDGSRLIGRSGGLILAMDYDATNQQVLIPSTSDNIYFDKNYNQMLSLGAVDGGVALQRTDLRAGADLPKQ